MDQKQTNHWSQPKKILFRFAFSYLLLYVILVNNGAYPFWYQLMGWLSGLMQKFIPWVGETILHLPEKITTFTNGSGDTTYDYVIILCIFIISIIATIIWSLLDRKRPHYKTLYYWITTAVRYYVGLMLISYGLIKIIQLQFAPPSFYRLIQPYGESSPMGLAWTFLGFSKGYNIFMGIAEIAAVLLLFRRTVTIGAIITLMTTVNVMAVNYFYDVPVKIVSTHLVLLTLFLLSRDIPKLMAFFLKGLPTSIFPIEQPKFKKKWLRIALKTVKVFILVYSLGYGTFRVLESQKTYGSAAPKPPLYGLYEVDTFVRNSDTLPPLLGNEKRWRYIRIEYENYFQVTKMDNKFTGLKSEIDTLKQVLRLTSYRDSTKTYLANYKKTDSTLSLSTIIEGDTISLESRRLTKKDFLLTNRGFHWISEYPYNR